MPAIYFVGVDVGTGSVRGALVKSNGQIVRSHTAAIRTWNPKTDHLEQSSQDVWRAVCECVKNVTAGVAKHEIQGIGFDATCSLVVLDTAGEPLSASTTGVDEQNIILWMDHRAEKEMHRINRTGHDMLKYVGGGVSIEMQLPKLLWLKNNMFLSCWKKAGGFFDLSDFLTWRCTGNATRSLCTVGCKWNYDAIGGKWPKDFLYEIELGELTNDECRLIGNNVAAPGVAIEPGLTKEAAAELNLLVGTKVASSMIDAHAGALALLGCKVDGTDTDLPSKMALICGTSSCHMSLTKEPVWAKGFWGPYLGALLPDMHLIEAGQSATGILIEHLVHNHPAYKDVLEKIGAESNVYSYLNDRVLELARSRGAPFIHELTKDVQVWPDFHGNRTPLADPTLKGMICGLTVSKDIDNLAVLYLAFLQALAYGTKYIIDSLLEAGREPIQTLLICGGLSKNQLFVQTHADVCTIPVVLPNQSEVVLLGASILGACAARVYPSLEVATAAMGGTGVLIKPDTQCAQFHRRKYTVFRRMVQDQQAYREIMMSACDTN